MKFGNEGCNKINGIGSKKPPEILTKLRNFQIFHLPSVILSLSKNDCLFQQTPGEPSKGIVGPLISDTQKNSYFKWREIWFATSAPRRS